MATPPSKSLLRPYGMIYVTCISHQASVSIAESIVVLNRAHQQLKTKTTDDFVNVALLAT